MFITRFSNPIYIGNIKPDHPPETITKVATIEIKIIHNLPRDINNTILGITSK